MGPKKVTSTVMNSPTPKNRNIKEWGKRHADSHRNLYNKWMAEHPDSQDTLDNYVYNNRRALANFVEDLGLSDSAQKGFFFMLSRWLEINRPNDRYIKSFQKNGYEKGQLIEEDEGYGQQTEREIQNYRPLGELRNMLEIQKD
jgi:hypothetical protein